MKRNINGGVIDRAPTNNSNNSFKEMSLEQLLLSNSYPEDLNNAIEPPKKVQRADIDQVEAHNIPTINVPVEWNAEKEKDFNVVRNFIVENDLYSKNMLQKVQNASPQEKCHYLQTWQKSGFRINNKAFTTIVKEKDDVELFQVIHRITESKIPQSFYSQNLASAVNHEAVNITKHLIEGYPQFYEKSLLKNKASKQLVEKFAQKHNIALPTSDTAQEEVANNQATTQLNDVESTDVEMAQLDGNQSTARVNKDLTIEERFNTIFNFVRDKKLVSKGHLEQIENYTDEQKEVYVDNCSQGRCKTSKGTFGTIVKQYDNLETFRAVYTKNIEMQSVYGKQLMSAVKLGAVKITKYLIEGYPHLYKQSNRVSKEKKQLVAKFAQEHNILPSSDTVQKKVADNPATTQLNGVESTDVVGMDQSEDNQSTAHMNQGLTDQEIKAQEAAEFEDYLLRNDPDTPKGTPNSSADGVESTDVVGMDQSEDNQSTAEINQGLTDQEIKAQEAAEFEDYLLQNDLDTPKDTPNSSADGVESTDVVGMDQSEDNQSIARVSQELTIGERFNTIFNFIKKINFIPEKSLEKIENCTDEQKQGYVDKWSQSTFKMRQKSCQKSFCTEIKKADDVDTFKAIYPKNIEKQLVYGRHLLSAVKYGAVKIAKHLIEDYPQFYEKSLLRNTASKQLVEKFAQEHNILPTSDTAQEEVANNPATPKFPYASHGIDPQEAAEFENDLLRNDSMDDICLSEADIYELNNIMNFEDLFPDKLLGNE